MPTIHVNDDIRQKMFKDLRDRSLYQKAHDFAMDYVEQAIERNVYPTDEALDNLRHFDEDLPHESSDASTIIEQLDTYGGPATVSQIGGRYFGFVNGSILPAAIAAKNLSIYWDQNTAMQVISPVSAKLEIVVEKWLNELFGLQDAAVGFVSGSSMSNFCGLAAGRYRLLANQGWDMNKKGLFQAPPLRVITGKETHSTILKAISLLGIGVDNIEWVETDDNGSVIAEKMPELDNRSLVILQAGNVNSGAFDPLESICQKAREAGAWVHIDGAFGLWAEASSNLKHLTAGMQLGHSWAADAHKTLNTPYDSGLAICADREALVAALHMSGGYIIKGADRDGMFYTPEMSRRARVVELWAALKYLGKSGVDQLVTGLHDRAVQFAEEISKMQGFQVLNDVVFNQVVVSCGDDELTNQTIKAIQELRECWVGGSTWKGQKVIRVSVCSWATTAEDITRSVHSFAIARARAMEIAGLS